MSAHLEKLIEESIQLEKTKPEDYRGCSDEEIAQLESRAGVTLPPAFTQYLRRMGKSAGGMLRGSDVLYGCLHLLTGEARECFHEHGLELPDDAFAFYAHQGYDYLYFREGEGEDPPVYRYHEAADAPRMVFRSFSDYLTWMFHTIMEVPPNHVDE